MSVDLERLMAAQAKADELAVQVGEPLSDGPHIRVAFTDAATGQRLATCFVTYQAPAVRHLRPAP